MINIDSENLLQNSNFEKIKNFIAVTNNLLEVITKFVNILKDNDFISHITGFSIRTKRKID